MKYTNAYNILNNVLNKGAYLNIELKNLAEPKAFNTRLIYGVLEKNITLDYYISKVCEKRPKNPIALFLKLGIYMLCYMNEPSHAVVNGIVETAKSMGKGGACGFINATLRQFKAPELPSGDSSESLSIRYSYPKFLVETLISQFGFNDAMAIMSSNGESLTHIRHNELVIQKSAFDALIRGISSDFTESEYGYYVTHSTLERLNKGYPHHFTVQQLGSMLICNAFTNRQGISILDMCAAPGGKSIYLAELLNAKVTACDIHQHRLDLIRFYASRMRAKIDVKMSDGMKHCSEFDNAFDAVLCDVPCSGFGVSRSKPDVFLGRGVEDIKSLTEVQLSILNNAARYVKKGGEIIYSTCTYILGENSGVVESFLAANTNFVLAPINLPIQPQRRYKNAWQYLPLTPELEGFFIAKLVRTS